jgi:hypothetical protein
MVHALVAQSTRGSAQGDSRSGLHVFDFWADDSQHYCRLSPSQPPAEPSTSEQAASFVLPSPMLEPHAACLYAFRPVCGPPTPLDASAATLIVSTVSHSALSHSLRHGSAAKQLTPLSHVGACETTQGIPGDAHVPGIGSSLFLRPRGGAMGRQHTRQSVYAAGHWWPLLLRYVTVVPAVRTPSS